MTYYRKFQSEAPEFLDLGNLSALEDTTAKIMASDLVDPKFGFARLVIDTDLTDLNNLEEKLVEEVSELTYSALEGLTISGVELLWTTNDQECRDYRARVSGLPFGNFHTDTDILRETNPRTSNQTCSFIKPKFGRMAIVLAGKGPLCIDRPVFVPEEDCYEYLSPRPYMSNVELTLDLAYRGGVITGVDGSFVRGYPDHRTMEGTYDPVVIEAGQAAIIGPTTIHQSYPGPNPDKRLILVDYKTS